MWLIYYKRTDCVLTPGYHRYWPSRSDALDWAEKFGYELAYITVCPVIYHDE